jgi:hypothetical protein
MANESDQRTRREVLRNDTLFARRLNASNLSATACIIALVTRHRSNYRR